jgi:hypothetical protein
MVDLYVSKSLDAQNPDLAYIESADLMYTRGRERF